MGSIGKCRLCGNTCELKDSHIIPKFVYDWMKKTGTGYIRCINNINKRLQDGFTQELLCHDCEELFSIREKYFNEHIFHKYLNKQDRGNYKYNENCFYFCISILWRVIISTSEEAWIQMPRDRQTLFHEVELDWRNYLLGKTSAPTHNIIHLFLTKEHDFPSNPALLFNTYMLRNVDSQLIASDYKCGVYAKFSRFILVAHVSGFCPREWINTSLSQHRSKINHPQYIIDQSFVRFLHDNAEKSCNSLSALNNNSIKAIRKAKHKIGKPFFNSDLHKISSKDKNTPPYYWHNE